jgi:uncharacterized protein (TIGR03435 family)
VLTHWCRLEKTAAVLMVSMAILQMQPAARQASASASPATKGAGKPAFDAASIRPSTQELVLKGVDFLNPASDAAPPPGGLFSWNVQLPWLVNFAYDLRSSQARRAAREALPKWAQEGWFTIEARAEGNPSRDDVRQMVRSLLEDRFQFAAHMEKREAQVYAIVVVKPGLGLRQHPEGAPCTLSSSQADEKKYPHLSPSYQAVPAHCGIFGRELSHSDERRLEMLNVTMQQIADSLGLGLPLLVVDKTGLAGRYDAVVDFGSDDVRPNADSSEAIGLPPLPGALEKQVGLKLVKQNGSADTLVIDHIERLSEN